MPCTAAQLAANRANAKKSTGPRTLAGKARARRNSFKHGLTGAGIVVADEDVNAIQSRQDQLEAELAPTSLMGRILVQRVAFLSIRLERSARNEAASISANMRSAESDFAEDRCAEVDRLMNYLCAEPAAVARKLVRIPEGIDRMIAMYGDLHYDLLHQDGNRWSPMHLERAENLMGRYVRDYRVSRIRALSDAIEGQFHLLDSADGAGLVGDARRVWAVDEMGRFLRGEIARLREIRETFNHGPMEQDRIESAARALFDASPQAILARKYEAATERAMYKALEKFQTLDESSMDLEPVEEVAEATPAEVEAGKGSGSLASCFPKHPERANHPEGRGLKQETQRPVSVPESPEVAPTSVLEAKQVVSGG